MKPFFIPSAGLAAALLKRRPNESLLLALILTGSLLDGWASAQTFTIVHNFGASANDGAGPRAGLVLSRGTLYGTTTAGGSLNYGALFASASMARV